MLRYRRRSARRRSNLLPELNLTPLIDTALTLLVIFMVTAVVMDNGIRIDLPVGQIKEGSSQETPLVVTVDKNGALFFDRVPQTIDSLMGALTGVLAKTPEAEIHIRADTNVAYGTVRDLFEKITKIGGRHVVLDSQKAS